MPKPIVDPSRTCRRWISMKKRGAQCLLVVLVLVTTRTVSISWPHRRAFFHTSISSGPRSLSRFRAGENVHADIVISEKVPHVEHTEEKTFSGNIQNSTKALILMDAFCDYHGLYLAERARQVYGVATISVLSDYMAGYFLQQHSKQSDHGESPDELLSQAMPSSLEEAKIWLQSLQQVHGLEDIVAVICESDPGLAHAEQLGEWLNVKYQNNNGPKGAINEARRNKFLMMETLRAAGVPVVQQQLCQTEDEAVEFASQLGLTESSFSTSPTRVVVKPCRGCGSDDVFLCQDLLSVRQAFDRIHGSTVFGSPDKKHESVLLQEFAVGQEFAIDTVSKNGHMKIAAIWKYDKRPANGAPFVYYATQLYSSDAQEIQENVKCILYDYLDDCLTALDIAWGITHSEVILSADSKTGKLTPRLVEVNCRQHNMNFLPLTMSGIGYNVFDMLLAAYLGDDNNVHDGGESVGEKLDWELLPNIPSNRLNAAMIHLVNTQEGILIQVNEPALYEIQAMESVWDLEVYHHFLEPGSEIKPTVDIKTDAGWVQLLHPDKEIFERDYRRIIELMPTLFEVEHGRR
ncbi:biotin carboxylase [Nitzschia inconspicua]|uniref:Biotin carboxylase n=1 Tax=Nitzschia inconspicua TaxID=303405 RepID=A0A9K3PJZ4_9STRA|nr:biotin carboxylase [Nitzschia inconspicua]